MRRQGSMPVRTLSLTLTRMAAGVVVVGVGVVGEAVPGGAAILLQPAYDIFLMSCDMVARGREGPCACGVVLVGRRARVATHEDHMAWPGSLTCSHGNGGLWAMAWPV